VSADEGALPQLAVDALALIRHAEAEGATLRAIGGAAISLLCPSSRRPPLDRVRKDLDLVGRGRERPRIEEALRVYGLRADRHFNALHGHQRLIFLDDAAGRQVDVFIDRLVMCHTLVLGDRLPATGPTIDPADLLLTKLQVVERTDRDLKDMIALLLDCEIDDGRVAAVLAGDWGWWRTATAALDAVEDYGRHLEGFTEQARLVARLAELRRRGEEEPKPLRWRTRAMIGDRVRWYEVPEEADADLG